MSSDSVEQSAETSQAPEPSGSASSATVTAATLTKSGSVSKIRSHRGNIPTLPQTKLCPLCPAKFTRTTHLNRHLKTHTNERLYECDRCRAQFTRSDLLNRHKRTCCDSSLSSRSRRKSCQSCAESKVKCDLQRPCSRCKARNRDCVYANTTTTIAENGAEARDGSSPEATRTDTSSSLSPPSQEESTGDANVAPQSSSGVNVGGSSAQLLTSADQSAVAPSSLDVLADGSFVTPSLSGVTANGSAAQSTSTERANNAIVVAAEGSAEERSYLSELFSSEMYDNLFSNLFTSSFEKNPIVPGHHFHADPTAILTDRLEATGIGQLPFEMFYDASELLAMYPSAGPSLSTDTVGNLLPNEVPQLTIPMSVPTEKPTQAELNEYLKMFFSTYSYHMSIVHLPTFFEKPRLQVLITAMQACGAMYANTPTAAKFIDTVLATARDGIIADLSSDNKEYDQIIELTLASALIQTIALFHRLPEQRAKANVYHGMIVMMLRMSGFVDKTRDWKMGALDLSDPAATDRAWREWVRYESAKRAIWACYLHDCCHAIYFNLSPTFRTEQFTLGLPSEDGLWAARNSTEWAMLLQKPSPYGSIEVRLSGAYLKALYFYLTQNNPDHAPRPFNVSPFAHFVMIHAMMRKLFEMYLRDRLPFSQPDGTTGLRPKLLPHFVDRDRAFHVQILLHYWLQSWLNSPETPRTIPEPQQRFCFNALPFYWLAQVGLVAYQEGLPPFEPEGTYITSHDAKFMLIKKWERHIRKFLASGEQTPTKFWDEVMKIRIESWQAESGFEYEHLLGFFGQQGS